jgi:hypothetical protein
MSFVDSDIGPLNNPEEVARAVAEARRRHPVDKSRPHNPIPHLILRLEKPISIKEKPGEPLYPEERNISEIDLGGTGNRVRKDQLGHTRFIVTGTLWHAHNVHHLRPIQMSVSSLEPAKNDIR